MARAPLLQLSDISLGFGGPKLLDQVDLLVHPGDRLALVGRNGSGKTSLFRILSGDLEADHGTRSVPTGIQIAAMEQDPDMAEFATLGAYAESGLGPGQTYLVDQAAEGLGFDPSIPVTTASGGERRRAALAKIVAEAPDLMLLDEPTNHLDIKAVLWLEAHLKTTRAAFVVVSHDRAFLRNLTRGTLWLDRGRLRRQDKPFEAFEAWRDTVWAQEDLARHKLDRKIAAEAKWAVEGISARRTRNQGRLRALQALRQDRSAMIKRSGTAALAVDAGQKSGRLVSELREVEIGFDGRTICKGVNLRLMRGDRLALVGPNGVGKTSLLNVLTGQVSPKAGQVRLGTGIEMAVFDQTRAALDPDMTLWDSLTGSPDLRVSGRADQVMVRGSPKHVVGYLKEFLFSEAQARAPVRALSGGEKARLLLAKLLARPSNLLVLDEPTNDLDIETLDLLQELIGEYGGTVIVVSHDRDFLDRVATQTLALEGDGRAVLYAGGWSDYQAQKAPESPERSSDPKPKPGAKTKPASGSGTATGLSFTEAHRLEVLPAEITRLEGEIAKLTELLSDPELFSREPVKFEKATEALVARQTALAAAEDEWLMLAEKAG